MKQNLFLLLLISVLATACGQKGYVVTGEVTGLEGKIYLEILKNKTPEVIDSLDVVDGKFQFKGNVELPILARIITADKKSISVFYIENSKISLKGSMKDDKDIVVEGSAENEVNKKISEGMKAAIASISEEDPDGDTKYNAAMDSIIAANPKSVAAAYLFYTQRTYTMTFEEMRAAVAKFDPSIAKCPYLINVLAQADILEKVAIGKPYIDFESTNPEGQKVKLSSVVGPGKYVLLDFWASWCGPCRRENPNVVADFNKFKEQGFTVLGVSLDDSHEKWVEAINTDKLEWAQVSELNGFKSAAAALYGVASIPSNVLIDPQGIIIARNLRGEDLTNELTKIFSKPTENVK